jgi:hypothetical protein
LIVLRNLFIPEISHASRAVLPKADIDEKVGEFFAGHEIRVGLAKFSSDARTEWFDGVPAS